MVEHAIPVSLGQPGLDLSRTSQQNDVILYDVAEKFSFLNPTFREPQQLLAPTSDPLSNLTTIEQLSLEDNVEFLIRNYFLCLTGFSDLLNNKRTLSVRYLKREHRVLPVINWIATDSIGWCLGFNHKQAQGACDVQGELSRFHTLLESTVTWKCSPSAVDPEIEISNI
ncbi:hypothetical protein KIN20_018114 [Parelaphostrongylus tenuis]|uniref:Uncharacterized protein n=1 Tax=Parelaphostrongylus tenuis TaxID=148309 RepID=A0AAD5QP71_PARTN|nr:hypothetical protein KIN20_018114 [Parelaphostrongylus tenuis]